MINKKKYKIAWITIYSEELCEIYCSHPFDIVCVDLEHSSINESQALKLIRIIQLSKKKAFVRVAHKKSENIKKILDSGADGIIVPDINNKADCELVIKNIYYSKKGNRGVGLHRANLYGDNFDNYFNNISKKINFIAIIESKEAVNNIDEILSIKSLTGVMIGPYDLSSSLGNAGKFKNKNFINAINKIKSSVKKYKKIIGIHIINPNKKDIESQTKDFTFLVYSLDSVIFNSSIKKLF